MPTGYTAAVQDGSITTLHEFALQCARGMGALIMMRDEPWGAPIPEKFEPSTKYYDEALAKARAELAEVTSLSNAECEARAKAEHEKAEQAWAEYVAGKRASRERYEAMLAQVEAWDTDAEGIKEFMLSQLRESITFDCGDYAPSVSALPSPDEWRAERMKSLAKDIGYHEERRAAEIARTEARNRWLTALRASLPAPAAPVLEPAQ